MPITDSAKKSIRKNKKREARNKKKKNRIKKLKKQIEAFLDEGKIKKAKEILPTFYKAVDKAAKTGVIKKNTASRKKSRMTKLIDRKAKS